VVGGGVAFDALSEGTTVVTATAPGFNSGWVESSVTVSVSKPGMSLTDPWYGAYRVGSSLQGQLRLTLGGSAHGGVTVRIASSDTIRLRVSPNATTSGTSFIDVFIPNGQTYADFYVQGLQGMTGNVTVTATNPLFTDGSTVMDVVQPVFRIENLSNSIGAGAADDPFRVRTGILNTSGTGIWFWQEVSAAGPVHVLISSSNPTVGKLRTAAEYGASVTVDIAAGSLTSPDTVLAGGVAFDALAAGTTNISAAAIGFQNSWGEATVSVTVTP
jgi:hypothetical protein